MGIAQKHSFASTNSSLATVKEDEKFWTNATTGIRLEIARIAPATNGSALAPQHLASNLKDSN